MNTSKISSAGNLPGKVCLDPGFHVLGRGGEAPWAAFALTRFLPEAEPWLLRDPGFKSEPLGENWISES